MDCRATLAGCAAVISLAASSNAFGQVAAETGQVLSGVGQQSGAVRSLGSAISRSVNGAGNTVRSRPNASRSGNRNRAGEHHDAESIPANVDSLGHTDAPTYRLSSGATIKVSGGLLQSSGTTCVNDCPEDHDHE